MKPTFSKDRIKLTCWGLSSLIFRPLIDPDLASGNGFLISCGENDFSPCGRFIPLLNELNSFTDKILIDPCGGLDEAGMVS